MSTWKMVIRSGKELMQIQPLVQIFQWLCMAGQSAAAAAVTWLTARLIGVLSGSSPAGGRLAAAVWRNLWAVAVFGIGQQHFLLLYGLWGCRRSAYFGTKAGRKGCGASSAGDGR